MGDMSERIMRMIHEKLNGNRETSGKGEKGKRRVNRGKEGEQDKPDKPERRERPDGMVQYRPFGTCRNCSIASLAGSERAKMRFCQRLNANG
ncbi:MAG: hypothetical protein ABIL40_07630 [candidate division WOR-3 bacterium]